MDDAARRRRARKALEALEQDNFHEDPHANLVMSKKAPKFQESLEGGRSNKDKRKRTRSIDYFKQRFEGWLLINNNTVGNKKIIM